MSFKKEFLKGSAAATVGTVSTMFFHFLSIMLLTRNLEKTEFGIYVLALVVVNLFVLLNGLGLNITLVKFITGKEESENYSSFRAIFILRTVVLALSFVLFYALSSLVLPLFGITDTKYSLYIAVLFGLANYRELFFSLLQGLRFYKKYAFNQGISAAARVAVILLFLQLDILTLNNLFFIEILTLSFSTVILIFMIPIRRMLSVRPTGDTYKSLIKFSMPVYLTGLLTFSHDRVNIFIIGAFLNPVSVAFFDIASKIPEALLRVFVSFTLVFFPNQSKFFAEEKKDEALKLMDKSLHFFSIAIVFGVLISFLFHKEIIILLFSRNYLESAFPFALLMLSFLFRVLTNIMGYTLVASGDSAAPAKLNGTTTFVNLVISIVLIPILGFTGAVYSLLIMNVVSQVLYHWYLVRSKLGPDGLNYLRPLALMLLLLVPYILLPESLLLKGILTVSYLVLCWFFVDEFRILISNVSGLLHKKGIISIT